MRYLGTPVQRADCIVVVIAYGAFRDLDFRQLRKLTEENPVMVDGRGLFNEEDAKKPGFPDAGIGYEPKHN